MRASMAKDRLSHLALLHIHYDVPIALDNVVDYYARLHPRRLELDSVLSSANSKSYIYNYEYRYVLLDNARAIANTIM